MHQVNGKSFCQWQYLVLHCNKSERGIKADFVGINNFINFISLWCSWMLSWFSFYDRIVALLTFWSFIQAALNKKVPIEEAELYFNLSDKVRQFTEDYFQLDTPLYFSYSHLVCRTSLLGKWDVNRQLIIFDQAHFVCMYFTSPAQLSLLNYLASLFWVPLS